MSLFGVGRQMENRATRSFGVAASLERGRNEAEENLERADKSRTMSNIGTGAGIGAAFGPQGALIGAGVGYLASELF